MRRDKRCRVAAADAKLSDDAVEAAASEQAASSRQEPEYQLNVDEVGLPLMIADAQGRVQHLNASFRAILAAANMPGADLSFSRMLVHNTEYSRQQALDKFQEALTSKEPSQRPTAEAAQSHAFLRILV